MWKTVKLKEICEVFSDGNWIETKHQSADGLRLIQTGNVKSGFFVDRFDKARFISEATFEELNCKEIFPGDILVSRLPEPVGRACIIPILNERAITAVDCTIIRVKKGNVLPEFLNYYMQSPSYFTAVREKVTGATRQRISRKNLGEIDLSLPPLAEQQRIVAKLDAAFAEIDTAIEVAEAKEAEVKKLKASLLSASLSADSVMWETVKLGEVAKPVGGSGFPKKYQGKTEGEVPFFKVSDMNLPENETHMLSANNYVSRETLKAMKAKAYPTGTIIFPKIGGAISTNKKRILATEAVFDNNVMGLVPNKEISSEYLYKFFLKLDLYELSNKAALPSITATTVKELDVALPKLEEQQRIVAKLDAAFAEIDSAKQAIQRAKENHAALKSAILAQELTPPSESEAA